MRYKKFLYSKKNTYNEIYFIIFYIFYNIVNNF